MRSFFNSSFVSLTFMYTFKAKKKKKKKKEPYTLRPFAFDVQGDDDDDMMYFACVHCSLPCLFILLPDLPGSRASSVVKRLFSVKHLPNNCMRAKIDNSTHMQHTPEYAEYRKIIYIYKCIICYRAQKR